MKRFGNPVSISCLAGLLVGALSAGPALAAESWIDCNGQKVTTGTMDGKPVNETKPAHDIYSFDDGTKYLYKYSEERKVSDPEPVTVFSPQEIKWGDKPPPGSSSTATWEGRLDRASLALTLNYQEAGTKIVWTEQCKASSPMPIATAAAAPAAPANAAKK